jgi:CDP-glycerol glycerophosphotransferase (TagB/SpsB family)
VIEGSRAASIERAPDDGYISSDAPSAAVELKLGHKIPRDWSSFCQEYVMMKGQYTKRMAKESKSLFTKRRYFKNKVKPDANEVTIVKEEDHDSFTWSQRLYLSRECATSEDRRQLPVLIVNLDGAVGYWDEQRRFYYVLRHKVVEGLIQLSYDFRLIAVSSARKRLICKVVSALMCMPITDEQRTDT